VQQQRTMAGLIPLSHLLGLSRNF